MFLGPINGLCYFLTDNRHRPRVCRPVSDWTLHWWARPLPSNGLLGISLAHFSEESGGCYGYHPSNFWRRYHSQGHHPAKERWVQKGLWVKRWRSWRFLIWGYYYCMTSSIIFILRCLSLSLLPLPFSSSCQALSNWKCVSCQQPTSLRFQRMET